MQSDQPAERLGREKPTLSLRSIPRRKRRARASSLHGLCSFYGLVTASLVELHGSRLVPGWRGSSAAQFNLVCFPLDLESSKLYTLYAAFWASWFGRVAGTVHQAPLANHRPPQTAKPRHCQVRHGDRDAKAQKHAKAQARQTPLTKPNPETPKHEPRTRQKKDQERKPRIRDGSWEPPRRAPPREGLFA